MATCFTCFFVVKNSAVQYRSNYKVVRSTWVTVQHPAFAINNYCIANAAAVNSSQKLQSSHRLQIIKPSPHIVRRGINWCRCPPVCLSVCRRHLCFTCIRQVVPLLHYP